MPAQSFDNVHAAVNKDIPGIPALAFKKKAASTTRANNIMAASDIRECMMVLLILDTWNVDDPLRKVAKNVTAKYTP